MTSDEIPINPLTGKQKRGYAGGLAYAKIIKQRVLDKYYSNPLICKGCGEIIKIPEGKCPSSHIQGRKYCSSSCFAKKNNKIRVRKKKPRADNFCNKCGVLCGYKRRFCDPCLNRNRNWAHPSSNKTNTHRRDISSHARQILINNYQLICCKCGYSVHVDGAHIKAVKSFNGDVPIFEINKPENLVPLCRNCHWEFDHLTNINKEDYTKNQTNLLLNKNL